MNDVEQLKESITENDFTVFKTTAVQAYIRSRDYMSAVDMLLRLKGNWNFQLWLPFFQTSQWLAFCRNDSEAKRIFSELKSEFEKLSTRKGRQGAAFFVKNEDRLEDLLKLLKAKMGFILSKYGSLLVPLETTDYNVSQVSQ